MTVSGIGSDFYNRYYGVGNNTQASHAEKSDGSLKDGAVISLNQQNEKSNDFIVKDQNGDNNNQDNDLLNSSKVRGQELFDRINGKKKAPYSGLADENGMIEHNGVIFQCDYRTNSINLGDVNDRDNVLTIPLTEGGCLNVHRDSLGQLSKAISLFSPADINLILRAIAQDTKVQQMKHQIEDDKSKIGESLGTDQAEDTATDESQAGKTDADKHREDRYDKLFENTAEGVSDAWMKAKEEVGADGLGFGNNGKQHITYSMVNMLTNQMDNYNDLLGNSKESAIAFAKEAIEHLENPLSNEINSTEIQKYKEQEKEFYDTFLKYLTPLM